MPADAPTGVLTEPAEEVVVTSLAALRVIANPLRMRLLELLQARARTAKELAGALDLDPHQLYYHLRRLEREAFIRVVETRLVAGITEKRYRATAWRVRVDQAVLASGSAPGALELETLLGAVLDTTRADITASAVAGLLAPTSDERAAGRARPLLLAREVALLSTDQVAAFQARLEALIREFATTTTAESDAVAHGLTVAFYPVPTTTPGATV